MNNQIFAGSFSGNMLGNICIQSALLRSHFKHHVSYVNELYIGMFVYLSTIHPFKLPYLQNSRDSMVPKSSLLPPVP